MFSVIKSIPSCKLGMLKFILRCSTRYIRTLQTRNYCKDTFDFFSTKVAVNTTTNRLPTERKITRHVIQNLEQISLVNLSDERGIKIIEEAVSYANQLEEIHTSGVEPLYTVLEDEILYLREDSIKSDVSINDLLSQSMKIEEGYYTAPMKTVPEAQTSESSEFSTKSMKKQQ